ncbi:MAG: hypothetical protein K2O94_02350 [Clostridiales bacterium]|nr:hypothetical protein [Clostridiales bacterium]
MQNNKQDENGRGKFATVLKKIFVDNIGWKLLAIVSAAVIWTLSAGL